MRIDEKKILAYLKSHIGENTTTYHLAMDAGAVEGMDDDCLHIEMWDVDMAVRRVADENGFRLNDDHCKDEQRGMPWVFDFFIEENKEKQSDQ